MLKPLVITLIIVILVAIGLNFDFFETTVEPISKREIKHSVTKETPTIDNNIESPKKIVIETQKENESNLSNELEELFAQASKLFQKNEDSEAHKIYDKIIELSKNSNDPKILKYFADAHYGKAFLYNIYPNNDIESAIEEYDAILQKFEKSDNSNLMKIYLTAKLQQAQLQSKDEMLQAYDELISKFGNDKENRFQKEVEELQFSKSFALMGVNDEEAMDVLDDIIAKYQDKGVGKLPETVQYSILNNIELSIITGNNEEKYVELANKYLSSEADTQPLLEMLNIVKNSQDLDQAEALTMWKEEHSDYHFPDWDFSELRKWANAMEDPERQARVRSYIDAFEKQKYNNYPNPYANTSKDHQDEGENENSTDSYEMSDNNPPIEYDDEPVEYEPIDPYINDIYQNNETYQPTYPNPEILYDNPYSAQKLDGVSHIYTDTVK